MKIVLHKHESQIRHYYLRISQRVRLCEAIKSVLETKIGKQFVRVALLWGKNTRGVSEGEKNMAGEDKSYAIRAT